MKKNHKKKIAPYASNGTYLTKLFSISNIHTFLYRHTSLGSRCFVQRPHKNVLLWFYFLFLSVETIHQSETFIAWHRSMRNVRRRKKRMDEKGECIRPLCIQFKSSLIFPSLSLAIILSKNQN